MGNGELTVLLYKVAAVPPLSMLQIPALTSQNEDRASECPPTCVS